MDTFLMICAVAADFGPYKGEMFRVEAKDIGMFIQAPAWVKETLMFKWLFADGSIKIGVDNEAKKKLENDPLEGISAEGKAKEITEANEAAEEAEETEEAKEEKPAKPVEVKTRTRTTKKGDSK